MDLTEAIAKSMRAYYKGVVPTASKSASPKGLKYTKKYFDKVGSDNGIEPFDLEKAGKKGKKSGY
jgi:hypothetical protein